MIESKSHSFLGWCYHHIYKPLFKNPIREIGYNHKLSTYWKKIPDKIEYIRNKDSITVLFVTTEIRSWKGLPLYLRMLKHPRFRPIVGANTNPKYPETKKGLISYLNEHGYYYVDLDSPNSSIRDVNPDIIIYDGPYENAYSNGVKFSNNLDFIFCGCDYCINITKHAAHLVHPWYDYCWQFYVEHEDVAIVKRELLGKRARNLRVTGVPIQDELRQPKEHFIDPWKDKTGKKRIIYAPHHSFKGENGEGIEFATFLEFGEAMQELALKYQDQITIAFKPHPYLYIRLLRIWGQEKTDTYYRRWQEMPNTQYENGEYFGLFKYSDAIIHDSASFIVEYLYEDKPSLFLVAESNHIEDMFDFVKDCFNSHEHGYNNIDIESFIQNVISGIDNMKEQRAKCIMNHLTPPNGLSACDNIINSILHD